MASRYISKLVKKSKWKGIRGGPSHRDNTKVDLARGSRGPHLPPKIRGYRSHLTTKLGLERGDEDGKVLCGVVRLWCGAQRQAHQSHEEAASRGQRPGRQAKFGDARNAFRLLGRRFGSTADYSSSFWFLFLLLLFLFLFLFLCSASSAANRDCFAWKASSFCVAAM